MTVRTEIEPRRLRDYQLEARDAVLADWEADIRRVGVVLPTGSGKSTVIGALVEWAWENNLRVVLLAHRAELLDQMIRDTRLVAPQIPDQDFGIVRAEHDDHDAPIVAATLQTLAKAHRVHALGPREVIIWDEVHHAPAVGYHASFTELGGYDGAYMCGFTATMYRAATDKGRAAQIGLGDVIEKISYERNLRWAVEAGHLVPPTGLTVRIEALNALNKVRNVAGDFHQGQLAEIMEAAVEYTVDAVEMHASDRRSIIFGASVAACELIVQTLNERGNLKAALTVGTMSYEERQPVYEAFRQGRIDCMVTVMVLSEGADFPMCDCVVMGRPTRSRVLYSQMVGRALRTFEGKSDALVLDLSGSTRQMKLIHLSELVHGLGIDVKEVDEDGDDLEPELCPYTGENILTCLCDECVENRTPATRARGPQRMGVVDMTPIDLLADEDNDTLWLETPAGVNFIPLSEGWLVFVWPRDGRRDSGQYAVGSINTRHGSREGGFTEYGLDEETGESREVYYPMATALRRAEEWAVDNRFALPSRFASWRRRNSAASDLQTGLARRLGIPSYDGMTRGRLSDEISIAFAAQALDHAVVNMDIQ